MPKHGTVSQVLLQLVVVSELWVPYNFSKSAAFLLKTCARVVEWLMLMVGIG